MKRLSQKLNSSKQKNAVSTWHWGELHAHIAPLKNTKVWRITKSGEYSLEPRLTNYSIQIDAGLNVTIIDDVSVTSAIVRNITVTTKKDSVVEYVIVGDLNITKQSYRFIPGENGTINVYTNIKCQTITALSIIIDYLNPMSVGNIFGALVLSKKGDAIVELTSHHGAEKTSGDILYKIIGDNVSQGLVYGMIAIDEKAKHTNSFLKQDALMISEQSEIKSIPNLEIKNNEVKASHSSAIGRIDDQAMYYLLSRGLSHAQAQKLLVRGFVGALRNKIPNKKIQQYFV